MKNAIQKVSERDFVCTFFVLFRPFFVFLHTSYFSYVVRLRRSSYLSGQEEIVCWMVKSVEFLSKSKGMVWTRRKRLTWVVSI